MERLKTVAMYLPQFHRIPENDQWWGEGFTDWTAVKNAEKLFEGHNQVREPLNDNYYDLLEKSTMEWQAELARKYNIYGFCFYHYYFKEGRKILERPAENLLKWKDINTHYCFCWANETWARTWSGVSDVNTWAEKFENKECDNSPILLEQDYGQKEQWKEHFYYLLPFFKDGRYIQVEGKPVFIFYKPDDITQLGDMVEYWNELAKLEGLKGIYGIGVNSMKDRGLDAIMLQGPNAYRMVQVAGMHAETKFHENVRYMEYGEIWDNAIQTNPLQGEKVYYGGFVDYDDTPRRGKAGFFLKGTSAELFENYLYKLAVKNMVSENELLFINAWNEWGEGNYLEPDKQNGYAFLEAVKRVVDKCNQTSFNAVSEWNKIHPVAVWEEKDKNTEKLIKEVKRYRRCYQIMEHWLFLKEKNCNLEGYFLDKNYRKIVIYGFAAIGKHLYEELKDTSIEIVCAMDRRKDSIISDIRIIGSDEEVPECDAIVVTVIDDSDLIVKQLQERTKKKIVALWDVVFYY